MDSKFYLQKYSLIKKSVAILEIDFALENYTFGEYRDFFVKDYLSLNSFSPADIVSEFHFEINGEKVGLIKSHLKKSLEMFIEGVKSDKDFFKYLSDKLSVNLNPENWSLRIIDANSVVDFEEKVMEINSKLQITNEGDSASIEIKINELLSKIRENNDEETLKKINKYVEINTKITSLESEVSAYQSSKSEKEMMEKKMSEFNNKKNMMNDKNDSIKILLESQKKITKKIEEIKSNNFVQIAESVKQKKIHERIDNLKKLKNQTFNKTSKVIVSKKIFTGKVLIGLIIVQLFLTILGFLLHSDPNIILIGIISIFSIVLSLFILNYYQGSNVNLKIINDSSVESTSLENKDENKLFINSAMLNALTFEVNEVESMIKSRLNNSSIEEFLNDLNNLSNEEQQLKDKLSQFNNVLSPEEYYKKRRELDISKIESENLEYTKDNIPDIDLVNELIALKIEGGRSDSSSNKFDKIIESIPILIINLKDLSKINLFKSFLVVK